MEKKLTKRTLVKKTDELAVLRVMEILDDRTTTNGDTFKAITLFYEHMQPQTPAQSGGDMEIRLREDE